jgi:hypothetical protein
MKHVKYFAVAAFLLFFCGISHHDQTFNENIFIGADDAQNGPNQRLYFGGAVENGDPIWMGRYDVSLNHTDLRVNIGDDNGDDRFVIGTQYWQDWFYHPYFVVNSNGRVGIGTEQIGSERLAVNGTIRAKELKIEAAPWDTPWPDYVFEKSYHLPELTHVAKFVAREKHLPDMPSAKEVAEQGVEVGKTEKLLLKKVEELTLYLIEKDKELSRLKKELTSQSKRIDQLELTVPVTDNN